MQASLFSIIPLIQVYEFVLLPWQKEKILLHSSVYERGMFEMRKVIIAVIGIASLCAPCFGAVRGAYHNHFALEFDYIYLRRSNSHNKHLVNAAGGPVNFPPSAEPSKCAKEKGKVLIDTRDLIHDMHFDSGIGGAIKIFPNIRYTVEARYMGGFTWKGKKTLSCLENLNLDGPFAKETEDYNFANKVKSIFHSKMYTLELDYIRHVTPRYTDHYSASWRIGLRYFDIDEKIKLHFTKVFPLIFPIVQNSRYRTKTENRALGLQIGGSLEYNPYHFLTWGFVAKIAGMYNRGVQRTLMLDRNNTFVFRHIDRSGYNFAYMGQFFPYIEIRPAKHFFFHVNYQVLFVGNIATADRNLRFHGSASLLDHRGHILYHGVTGALQINF